MSDEEFKEQQNHKSKKRKLSKAEIENLTPIFDRDDPKSIYNLATNEMQAAMDDIEENHSYLLTWGVKGLEKQGNFDVEVYQLRISFWLEYNKCLEKRVKMSIQSICRGICSRQYFYTKVLRDPKAMLFVLFQPQDYVAYMTECLDLAARDMRDILSRPHEVDDIDKYGHKTGRKKLDYKLIEKKIKIWEKVENRVKGLAPQTLQIQQTSQNFNYNKSASSEARTVEELEAEIKRLESKDSETIDVQAIESKKAENE